MTCLHGFATIYYRLVGSPVCTKLATVPLPLPESVSLLCLWQGPIDPSPSITDGWVGQTCGGPGPVDKAAVSLCLPCILSPLETSALRHGLGSQASAILHDRDGASNLLCRPLSPQRSGVSCMGFLVLF